MVTFQEELTEILYNVRSKHPSETPKAIIDEALTKINAMIKSAVDAHSWEIGGMASREDLENKFGYIKEKK
jgi:hypothetical protein